MARIAHFFFILTVVVWGLPQLVKAQINQIYISEVMYDTPLEENKFSADPHHNGEFIKLYNPTPQVVDLSGWILKGDGSNEQYTFNVGEKIEPGKCLVIAYQSGTSFNFTSYTGCIYPVLTQSNIILNNKGETLYLFDSTLKVIDLFRYLGGDQEKISSAEWADNDYNPSLAPSRMMSLLRKRVSRKDGMPYFVGNEDITHGFTQLSSPGFAVVNVISEGGDTGGGSGNNPPSLSQDHNYILTKTYTIDNGSTSLNEIKYFDGLGRLVQTVQAGITPFGNDLVTYKEYDEFGRESNTWLPRPSAGNSGTFVQLDAFKGLPKDNYTNDEGAFSYPVYETSPLNRVLKQYGPGQAWQSEGKSVNTKFLTNTRDYPCKLFELGTAGLTDKGLYSDGQLYVTETTSEEGNISYEFKNKLGQVVLTRRMNGGSYDTYFVYDDFGNLRYVLPPLAVDNLSSGLGDDSEMMKQYAYVYKYDARNHCVKKRIPGCDWIYYVYDKADRLVLSQNGVQRKIGKWSFNKFDALGRILISGIFDSTDDLDVWQNRCKDIVVVESKGGSYGYTWNSLPQIPYTGTLIVNHYDDYDHLLSQETRFKTDLDYKEESGYGTLYLNEGLSRATPKGLLTGKRVKFTDGNGNIIGETVTAYYYDYHGRVVQTKSYNHLGGTDFTYTAYDFTGHPTQKKLVHTSSQAGTQTEVYTYTYDHAKRLKETRHQLNGGSQIVLTKLTYDELGRVCNRQANESSVSNTNYAYNVRSWTTSISDSRFKENLTYKYDGNISRQETLNNGKTVVYDFTYDKLSRLKNAISSGSFNDAYSSTYEYDKQGNINTISKKRLNGDAENISFDYIGNQMLRATNSVQDGAFADYVNADTEYVYDANGSITKDLNRGISKIQYNQLNLPRTVDIKSPVAEAHNSYIYSADSVKLRMVQQYNSNFSTAPVIGSDVNLSYLDKTKTTDYVGNKIFENNVLKRILVDGGYIEGGKYYFYLTDHLGNNRLVVREDGIIVQNTDYYPYGEAMAHSTGDAVQPYKFGGKEYDAMHGLNFYDFSARMKSDWVFTSVDPLAEKYYDWSPYAYCGNNPMKYVDLRGDSLTLAGSTSDVQATANTYNTGLGGCYTVTADANGKMSISPVAGTDPNNMTAEQKTYYESLNKVISGTDGMTTINVVNGTEIVIGDVIAKTIDIGDIQALGNGKDINQGSALLHETIEQYGIQVKGQEVKSAHLNASGVERLVTGSYVHPLARYNEGGQYRIPILDPITVSPIRTVIIYVNDKGNVTGIKR